MHEHDVPAALTASCRTQVFSVAAASATQPAIIICKGRHTRVMARLFLFIYYIIPTQCIIIILYIYSFLLKTKWYFINCLSRVRWGGKCCQKTLTGWASDRGRGQLLLVKDHNNNNNINNKLRRDFIWRYLTGTNDSKWRFVIYTRFYRYIYIRCRQHSRIFFHAWFHSWWSEFHDTKTGNKRIHGILIWISKSMSRNPRK